MPEPVKRKWGEYEVLHEKNGLKLKRVTIREGGVISEQYHKHRDEYWVVVEGEVEVVIDGQPYIFWSKGPNPESFVIRAGEWHQITATEHSVLIEVQEGEYCGEDDIERREQSNGK